jgi:hypothetical protein
MKKEQIETMIDKKIENKFSTGSIPSQVVSELITMTNNINKVLIRENITLDDYRGVEWESIEKVRVKYAIHYIKHCNKRIFDLDWVKSKKGILSINYWEIWRLFMFREKITKSNPKVDIKSVFQKQLERVNPLTEKSIANLKDKKWYDGSDKKVGQITLKCFLSYNKNNFKLVDFPMCDIDKYEVDEEYCEKIGYAHMYIPYLKRIIM